MSYAKELIEARKTECAGCGCEGYYCDTSAGEFWWNEKRYVIPSGGTVLMVGKVDGSCVDDLFCDVCAENVES